MAAPRGLPSASVATPVYAFNPPDAALVFSIEIAPYLVRADEVGDVSEKYLSLYRRFEDIRLCLALSGPTPVLPGPQWFQYVDPDLEGGALGASMRFTTEEIVPFHLANARAIDFVAAAQTVRAFLALDTGLADRVRIAMERLHNALVRRSPGDKAVELAVALEALLVNSTSGEHTSKIALRAALLTSTAFEDRTRVRGTVEAIYGVRSALMHSGHAGDMWKVRGRGKMTTSELVKEGEQVTAQVIQAVLRNQALPDWERIELGQ